MFKIFFDKKFLKFLLTGVANTLLGMVIMFGCYNVVGWGYWTSTSLAYVGGGLLSYFLNRQYTFQSNVAHRTAFVKFFANLAVCYVLAYSIARPLVSFALSGWITDVAIIEQVAMLAGIVIYSLLNYMGQYVWVFCAKK